MARRLMPQRRNRSSVFAGDPADGRPRAGAAGFPAAAPPELRAGPDMWDILPDLRLASAPRTLSSHS